MQNENILVWLPSPMGDAVLCTPALRAIRQHFKSSKITFYANSVVRGLLSPCDFNDAWLNQQSRDPFKIARLFREHKFTSAVLFKNSFSSALAVFLAAVPSRIGYVRQGRGFLLTDKLYPAKLSATKFKPSSMIDYYLIIASWLGCDTSAKDIELQIDPQQRQSLMDKFAELTDPKGPVIVIVPGGAFGPSKCWPSERFARTADWLVANYNTTVVISISQATTEKRIAEKICSLSDNKFVNLGQSPVSLGELKALFSIAELVITNDTGPRHIAKAFGRKVISLFGPNNPAWTQTDYENEIQIVGTAACVPCDKAVCEKEEHLCMRSITVEMVRDAIRKLVKKS